MAAKLEVQVRHCFCCGLTPGTFLIGLYSLLLYALLTGLAAWALSDTSLNGDKSYYEGCQAEAMGRPGPDRRLQFHGGQTTVVIEDSSSYHCSFGMYTEEMKFAQEARSLALLIALCLYVPLVLASLGLLAGVATGFSWLLLPWLILMPLDIIRGLISSVLILIMPGHTLARIATGIFFLGLQFLHISLWILVLAKFQRLRHRRRLRHGAAVGPQPQYDVRQPFPPVPQHQQQPYGGFYGPPSAAGGYAGYSPQSGRRMAADDEHGGYMAAAGPHHQQPRQQPNYEPGRY